LSTTTPNRTPFSEFVQRRISMSIALNIFQPWESIPSSFVASLFSSSYPIARAYFLPPPLSRNFLLFLFENGNWSARGGLPLRRKVPPYSFLRCYDKTVYSWLPISSPMLFGYVLRSFPGCVIDPFPDRDEIFSLPSLSPFSRIVRAQSSAAYPKLPTLFVSDFF